MCADTLPYLKFSDPLPETHLFFYLDQWCVIKIDFICFSTKTYFVGTQKNRLSEMALLSNQNKY